MSIYGNLFTEEYLTENIIFSQNDICKDIDKFESGKSNVLLVTGFSGSGKSTLAGELSKKYNCIYFELDALDFYNGGNLSLEDAKNGEPVLCDFIKAKKLKPGAMKNNDPSIYFKLYEEYIKYIVQWCKKRKDNKFIIEGLQIYEIFDEKNPQSFIISNPIIIKGTSGIKSAIRATKRNSEEVNDTKLSSKLKQFTGLLKWMIEDNKRLESLKKSIEEGE